MTALYLTIPPSGTDDLRRAVDRIPCDQARVAAAQLATLPEPQLLQLARSLFPADTGQVTLESLAVRIVAPIRMAGRKLAKHAGDHQAAIAEVERDRGVVELLRGSPELSTSATLSAMIHREAADHLRAEVARRRVAASTTMAVHRG